jgi:hypothetical protein
MSAPLPIVPAGTVDRAAARRAVLHRRIWLLVAATIGYNVVEAVVAITAGAVASSTALIGFGLDSVVEVALRSGGGVAVHRRRPAAAGEGHVADDRGVVLGPRRPRHGRVGAGADRRRAGR